MRSLICALGAALAFGGVAQAEWSVRPDSGWIIEEPTAIGTSTDGSQAIGITCFSGKPPIFLLFTGQETGPALASITMRIDGRSYVAEAQREDDTWVGEPTPLLMAALARGIELDVLAPGAKPARISLRGSARAISTATTDCFGS